MIKEKYQWYISIFTLILAVIFIFSFSNFSSKSTNEDVTGKRLQMVLNKDQVTDISIDIDEADWNWLLENASQEEFKSCNITINGETYYNVGIRPKGNSSLSSVVSDDTTDRYSFKIKFDKYVSGQTYNGMESIVLNNMIEDNTYMKEYISYDLYDFMGIAVPEMSYSNIKINGEDWGLYLALEVIDERYLENNFGTTEGNLYKPETMGMGNKGGGGNPPAGGPPQMGNPPDMDGMPNPPDMNGDNENKDMQNPSMPAMNEDNAGNPDIPKEGNGNMQGRDNGGPGQMGGPNKNSEGADFVYIDDEVSSYGIVRDSAVLKKTTDSDFERVINMFKNLNDGTNLEEVLDVEEVLKYFAVNTYLVNLDSYSGAMYHNYYLYEKDGVCQILPWDLNLSFGGFMGMGGKGGNVSSGESMINFPIDNPVTGDLESMPLIGKLLEVDEYKELYHSYLKEIAENYFNNGYYANLVNKLDDMINNYVKEDKTAFCTYEQYEASIPEMITFGEDRTKSVLAQLSGEQPSTDYGNVESTIDTSKLSTKIGMKGGPQGNKKEFQQQKLGDENVAPQPQNNDLNTNNESEKIDENNNFEKNNQKQFDGNKQQPGNMNSGKSDKNIMIVFGVLLCLSVISVLVVSKFKRRRN